MKFIKITFLNNSVRLLNIDHIMWFYQELIKEHTQYIIKTVDQDEYMISQDTYNELLKYIIH